MLSVPEPAGGPRVVTTITTKRGLRIMGLAAIVASAAAVNSIGAQGDPVTIDVSQCVNLPTPEQRLACFEAQVETARTAPPAAAAPALWAGCADHHVRC